MKKRDLVSLALATLGIAAVGSTALPLVQVWQAQYGTEHAQSVSVAMMARSDQPTEIVVDLADNASPADIAEVEGRIGAKLRFNSPRSHDDKIMVATLPTATDAQNALSWLRGDSNVEAAEPEMVYAIPERSRVDSVEMQAVAVAEASRNAVVQAKIAAAEAKLADMATYTLGTGESISQQERIAESDTPGMYTGCFSTHPYTIHTNDTTFRVDNTGAWMFEPVRASTVSLTDADVTKPGGTRPNDPLYDQQWNFKMVGAEDAWKKTRGKGVVVAVIDTGVAAVTTSRGKQCKDFNTTKFVKGYDFVNKDTDPYDDHGHGTHVAGTIAESTNNNEGVAGLAYEATIMPLKVLSAAGSGYSSDIADAIRYAADNGANVINMSLGSNQPSSVIHKACQYAVKKGVTIVCAAGNGFGEPVGYPAAFPECIAISSVGPSGNIATYSSYGKEVALAAPGGDMMESGDAKDGILQNTVMTGKGERGRGDDYYAFQGTSMASPHAAAVAALIASQGVHDPARVRDILTKSAKPNGDPLKYGAGILSAAGAVAMTSAVEGVKLRHILLFGGLFLLMAIGPRRSFWTRAGMAGALGAGFFGADVASEVFGANSPWNLLTFSAVLPFGVYMATRKSLGGAKIAGAFALGTAVNLWAGWHNNLTPFTAYTFGESATTWTLVNMGAAFAIANVAGWKAVLLSRKAGGTGDGSGASAE